MVPALSCIPFPCGTELKRTGPAGYGEADHGSSPLGVMQACWRGASCTPLLAPQPGQSLLMGVAPAKPTGEGERLASFPKPHNPMTVLECAYGFSRSHQSFLLDLFLAGWCPQHLEDWVSVVPQLVL